MRKRFIFGKREVLLRLRFIAVLKLLSAAAAGSLLFGFLAPWLEVADAAAHFRFHLVVSLGIAATFLALLGAMASALILTVLVIAGAAGLAPAFQLPLPSALAQPRDPYPNGADAQITLVQLNLNFRNPAPDQAVALIRARGADVVTLQEVAGRGWRAISTLKDDYPFRVVCPSGRAGAVAVLSRLPIAPGRGTVNGCINGQGLAWIRVMVGTQPLSVASVHLRWPYPFGQAAQVDRLEEHLAAIPKPVVVGGDFNAAPWSHSVDRIAGMTGTQAAEGLRLSLRLPALPRMPLVGLPIDHVLMPPRFSSLSTELGPLVGSDHLPVIARLEVAGPFSE